MDKEWIELKAAGLAVVDAVDYAGPRWTERTARAIEELRAALDAVSRIEIEEE